MFAVFVFLCILFYYEAMHIFFNRAFPNVEPLLCGPCCIRTALSLFAGVSSSSFAKEWEMQAPASIFYLWNV